MAFELQAAKTKQRIMEEQMQVKVVERSQEIAVQEQEMMRREKELDATIRRPADAEKYRYNVNLIILNISNILLYTIKLSGKLKCNQRKDWLTFILFSEFLKNICVNENLISD